MSTSITVEFQVNDLDANYEVVGTSDNYSFQEKIGLGSDIVFAEGDAFVKVIPLRGNYGIFDVRVFAVTEIGVRSPSVIGRIEVLPKELEGTFTFSEINTNQNLESSVIYSPTYAGDKLEIDCEFGGKSIEFNWSLIPPNGHPQEGNSLSTELLSDTFLSGFKINLFNDGQIIDLEQASYSETSLAALSSTLQTEKENVQDIFNNYRDFSLRLNEAVFNDLNLSRDISLQIISVDRFGGESTGIANATNLEPVISNLNYSTKGSDTSFSWESTDADFKDVKIEVLAIPEGTSLIQEEDLQASASYFQALKQAKPYNDFAGAYYTAGDKVVYNGKIYEAIQTHTRGNNEYPDDDFEIDEQTGEVIEGVANWALIGDAINFLYFSSNDPDDDLGLKNINEDDTLKNVEISDDLKTFSATQLWGYKYYYTFQPYDEFGEGKVYNLTKKGLIDKNADDSILEPILVNVKIDNLRFREVKDDLVFNWDATDQDGNLVDLNQYKFLFGGQDFPSLLGISGSLYDVHTNQKITGITNGFNSKSLDFDEDGDLVVNSNLPSAKVFDQYKYTRELNNSIYKTGGFPSDFGDYDTSTNYVSGDNVLSDNKIYTANTQNNEQSPNVQPYYSGWSSSQTYYASSSDAFNYRNNIYKTINDFGPNSSNISGLFNEGLVYNVGDIVLSPESDVSVFSESDSYVPGDFVFYSGSIYECLQTIATEENAFPDNADFWSRLDIFNDLTCAYFQSTANSNSSYPFDVSSNWSKVNPASLAANGQFFEFLIPAYELPVSDWSSQDSYNAGNFVVYENDIWSGTQFSQNQIPSEGSNYWSNQSNSQDIGLYSTYYSRNYQSGDLVYSNNFVYKCTRDDPAGGPITAITNEGQSILSSYEQTNWLPYWELNDQYDNIVFKHVGIPQSGKRSVGIELGIVDKNGRIINQANLLADNPPPYILTEGFDVDSTGEATKVKFNFNYALGFQEKTTKVYLYRSESPDFDVVDEYGFPLTGENTPFVKSVVGAGDATFGQNITQIIDEPPIPHENDYSKYVRLNQEVYEEYIFDTSYQGQDINSWGENHWEAEGQSIGLSMPTKKVVTGHYYKLLPFDDFGSGVAHTVRNAQGDSLVNVVPKNFHNKDPFSSNGPVVRANPNAAEGAVPSAITDFRGDTIFENFILNWSYIDNDIDFFEVWTDRGDFDGDRSSLITGNDLSATGFLDQANNTGYRRIDGPIYEIGDVSPRELVDEAWKIRNAKWLFDVSVTSNNIEAMYPGATNQERNFWVRAVDMAGNKGPFTGVHINQGDSISGLSLKLEPATATDVSDFEIRMTEKFSNTVALVPNNPFEDKYNGTSDITWSEHYLFNQGTGYIVSGSFGATSDQYIWWDKNDSEGNLKLSNYYVKSINGLVEKYNGHDLNNLLEFQVDGQDTLRNVYFSGVGYSGSYRHPAGSDNETNKIDDFDDGDFIIARNTNGITTVVNHAFANALIGTANIAEASIIDAQIDNLKANKILAETISGQDIQIWGLEGEEGAVRTRGFTGVDHSYNDGQKGFLLSGDGSFAFQGGDSSLSFENDTLTLVGKIKQSSSKDYDFIDVNVIPEYFNYIEAEEGFVLLDDSKVDIEVSFRNSTLTDADSDKIYFKLDSIVNGQSYPVFDYGDLAKDQIISGFQYHTFQRKEDGNIIAKATLSGGFLPEDEGFHDIITNPVAGVTGDAVVLYVSGANSTYERSATISRVIDGKIGIDGEPAKTVKLEATDYSIVYDDKGLSPEFKSGPDGTQIQISAEASNFYSSPQYRFTEDGIVDSWGTASVFNIGPPNEWSQGAFVIKVEVREGSSGDVSASDSISIIRVKQGENALAGVLTNENHTIPANNDGSFLSSNLDSAGGNFEVFYGGEKITSNITFGVTGSSVKNGLKITIDESGVYTLSNNTASTWSTDSETFDLTATYDGETITKRYSISKSKEGIQGVHARSIRLEASSLIFKEDKDSVNVSPDYIKLTAHLENFTDTITWTTSPTVNLYNAATGGTTITSGLEVYLRQSDFTGNNVQITASSGDLSDSVTIIKVKDGSNNVQAMLSNESHTLTELSGGNFNLSGSGTEIQVFDGSNLLQYTSGTLTDGKFKVSVSKTGGVNFGTSSTAEGSTTYTISDLSSATGAGTVTFTITAQKGNGETVTITKVQSFAVSKFGANGVMGVSPAYRGEYDSNKRYFFIESTENKPGRGDVIEYTDGLYYICTQTHGDGISPNPNAATPGDPSDFWRSFDAQFENVATDLLLTKEAFITTTLTVGETNPVDGPASYFKFDANAGRLDMRGAVVNNTVAQDISDQLTDINLNGSASIGLGGTVINGASTVFTTDLLGENYIRLVQGSSEQIFTIVSVDSDTQITVKESSLYAFAGAGIYKEKPIATFIGGGYNNLIDPFSLSDGGYQSLASSVVGGAYNEIIGRFSFIGNGFDNTCYDNFSAIVGGYQNTMPKLDSANQGANFIGAGQNNTINGGTNQSILGGSDNTIENL